MKKQINPTTKAHLIRGAFYLLLLIAVCAIPFALAQRNTTKQSMVRPAGKPLLQLNLAPGQQHAAPPSTGAVSAQTQPSGLRGVPELPRISQFPQRTSGNRGAHIIPILGPPKAPQVVLYDQYNNNSLNATIACTFTDFPTSSADLADDFVVPGGQTWTVQSIDADGVYFNG